MKLKGYYWSCHEDAEKGIAVVAENSKEARNIGSQWWGEQVGHDSSDWFIEQRCKLMNKYVKDLPKGVILGKQGLIHGLYGYIENEECDICKKLKTVGNVTEDNKCVCDDCYDLS